MAEFDIAVIGAGSAGLSVANAAARLGLRTVIVERAEMGGDCLNAGCVPSKALLAAGRAAQAARGAGRFGVGLEEPAIDWAAVRAHVRGAIAAIAPVDSQERYEGLGCVVLRGAARFVAWDTLAVTLRGTGGAGGLGGVGGERRLTAGWIVVAAGSRPVVPAVPGLADVPYLTNETLFALEERPGHLVVLGGGSIGLEMAEAHAALGCRVSLVEQGRIAAREDPALAEVVRAALLRLGVAVIEGVAAAAAERDGEGVALVLADGRRVAGSHLLVAAGRRPSLEGLGLEAGGVRFSERGVAVDRGLRSVSNRRVYAAGDVADVAGIGPLGFTHLAGHHAGVVVRGAVFRLPARVSRVVPRVTYTTPELAQVGLTPAEARAAGHDVEVLRWDMAENDRAVCEADTRGLALLVVSRSRLQGGRLLGAGIAAPHAGETIGLWALALGQRVGLAALAGMIVAYPTRAEAGRRAAGNFYTPRLFSGRTRRLARLLARLP